MPLLPKILNHNEAASIVESILEIDPEEYEAFHLKFIFECLKPGQKYSYVSILKECSSTKQFERYESILSPLIPSDSWKDFSSSTKWN